MNIPFASVWLLALVCLMAESLQQVGKLPLTLLLSAALWASKTMLEWQETLVIPNQMGALRNYGVLDNTQSFAARAETGTVRNTCDQAAEETRKMHVHVRAFCYWGNHWKPMNWNLAELKERSAKKGQREHSWLILSLFYLNTVKYVLLILKSFESLLLAAMYLFSKPVHLKAILSFHCFATWNLSFYHLAWVSHICL